MNKSDYYNKGFAYARLNYLITQEKKSDSWQRKSWLRGYKVGIIYMQAEALLHGFENVREYQSYLIRSIIK